MEDAERLLNQYTADMNEAELYLESNERLQAACLAGVAVLFNCLKNNSRHLPTGPLRQLYTADFDEDQVWEELQLVNEPALLSVSRVVSGMKTDLQQLLVVAAAEEECVLEENEVGMGERETSRTEDDGMICELFVCVCVTSTSDVTEQKMKMKGRVMVGGRVRGRVRVRRGRGRVRRRRGRGRRIVKSIRGRRLTMISLVILLWSST